MTKEWLALFLVIAMGALFFFPGLGKRLFWYSYEARVAQVARQMLRSSTFEAWLLPRLGDQDRLKKPPLAYWLAALVSSLAGGVSHFTARLPNACAAIGCLVIVYAWAKKLHSNSAGILAAAALATCGLFWQQGRSAGIEMPLLFFNLLALHAWWRYRQTLITAPSEIAAPACGWLLLTYTSLGFAFLQKGPVGPILILLIIVFYLGLSGDWRIRGAGWRWHGLGILLFMILSLPWYAVVMYCKPEAWAIWFRESAGRIEGFDHLRHPTAYFVWQMLGNGQPWILPALLSLSFFRRTNPEMSKLFIMWVWTAVTLVFFSIPGSKKNYYLLPVYPSLAIQAAIVFAAAADDVLSAPAIWLRRLLLAGGIILATAAPLMFFLTPHMIIRERISPIYATEPQFSLSIALLLAMGIAVFMCARCRRFYAAAGILTAGMASVFAIYLTLVPYFDMEKSQQPMAQALQPHLRPSDDVYTYYHFAPEELMWYLDHPVKMLATHIEVQNAMAAQRRGAFYLLADNRSLARFPMELRAALLPLPHAELPDGLRWWRLNRTDNN